MAQALGIWRCRVKLIDSYIQYECVSTIRSELIAYQNRRSRFGGSKLRFDQLGEMGEGHQRSTNYPAVKSCLWPRHYLKRTVGPVVLLMSV